jgi:hypothetical protein
MTFIRARPSADRQDRLLRALGNRQPAVHPQTASVTRRRVGNAAVTAASAGRVSANRVCNGNAMDVRVSSVCEVHFTGSLRPPLLRRGANVCRRNSDFCDAQTYIRPRAAGVSPPWCASHPRHRKLPTVGLRRPLLTQQRSPIAKRHSRIHMRFSTKSGGRQPAVVRFPSATSEVAIPERMSRSANRHLGDVATILLNVLVAAYFRLFGVAGIEGRAERPKLVLKKCRQPTRRRTCRMTLHVYLGAR